MFKRNMFPRSLRPAFRHCALTLMFIAGTQPNFAQKQQAPTFPSVEAAVDALYTAVQTNNEASLSQLVGHLASSSDPAEDKAERELFVRKYQEMHRLVTQPDGAIALHIGAENWPFPVPLISKDGKWRFDMEAGMREVMFRKIGENENKIIELCRDRGYAITHPGANVSENVPAQEFVRKLAESKAAAADAFFGYVFRKLTKGETFVAYPVDYGWTGITSFVITGDGTVYEKDLGRRTPAVAKSMVQYKPDQTWHLTEQ